MLVNSAKVEVKNCLGQLKEYIKQSFNYLFSWPCSKVDAKPATESKMDHGEDTKSEDFDNMKYILPDNSERKNIYDNF